MPTLGPRLVGQPGNGSLVRPLRWPTWDPARLSRGGPPPLRVNLFGPAADSVSRRAIVLVHPAVPADSANCSAAGLRSGHLGGPTRDPARLARERHFRNRLLKISLQKDPRGPTPGVQTDVILVTGPLAVRPRFFLGPPVGPESWVAAVFCRAPGAPDLHGFPRSGCASGGRRLRSRRPDAWGPPRVVWSACLPRAAVDFGRAALGLGPVLDFLFWAVSSSGGRRL